MLNAESRGGQNAYRPEGDGHAVPSRSAYTSHNSRRFLSARSITANATTLMHWFSLDPRLNKELLRVSLKQLATEIADVKLVSERFALFGPHNDVLVHMLERNPALLLLHTKLFAFLAKWDSLPAKLSWVGAGYNPHVSDCNGVSFTAGTTFTATQLVLVERQDDGAKKVLDVYRLGAS